MNPPDTLSVRQYGSAPGSHSHPHFQILIGLTGTLELDLAGHAAQLRPGTALVLSPHTRHDFESRDGNQCLVLDTHKSVWAHQPVQPVNAEAVRLLSTYLACSVTQGLPGIPTWASHLLLASWAPQVHVGRAQRPIDWTRLTQWVNQRLAHPLTATDLAAQVHLSESQLRARCLQTQGCSPMAWVRGQRLAHAQVLRAGGASVAEAARRSGYRSPSALTAALRAQTLR